MNSLCKTNNYKFINCLQILGLAGTSNYVNKSIYIANNYLDTVNTLLVNCSDVYKPIMLTRCIHSELTYVSSLEKQLFRIIFYLQSEITLLIHFLNREFHDFAGTSNYVNKSILLCKQLFRIILYLQMK